MSTRGCIARLTSKPGSRIRFKGVYSHYDNYPSGIGSSLFQLRNGYFKGDTKAMLKVLIDDHPAGWSNIMGCDFSLPIGFQESNYKTKMNEVERAAYELYQKTPHCYCHGERNETPMIITQKNASGSGCEYVYAFTKDGNTMYVLSSYSPKDDGTKQKMIGMFGQGDPNAEWFVIGQIDLNRIEPLTEEHWNAIPIIQVTKENIDALIESKVKEQQVKETNKKAKEEEDKAFEKSELSELIG